MNEKIAILYLTHQWRPVHAARFGRLQRETAGMADSFVVLQRAGDPAGSDDPQDSPDLPSALHTFDPHRLPVDLGYPYLTDKGVVPGCAHYPIIAFARRHPYPYYWIIENDVEFSGDWSRLIGDCAPHAADLIAAHTMRYQDKPHWSWWPSLRAPTGPLASTQLLKAFFPVYRISRTALLLIDSRHGEGWRGHCEGLIPTLLGNAGMTMMDLRSVRDFYLGRRQAPPKRPEHLAHLSTLRWRPAITRQEFLRRFSDAVIFHPVKDDWTYNGADVEMIRNADPAREAGN